MVTYIARRLLLNVGIFLVISVGIFGLVYAAPGDPIDMQLDPNDTSAGTFEYVQQRKAELGLDQPLPLQYLAWITNALRGHLGFSYVTRRPVLELIGERLPATMELMGLGMLLALAIAIPLGILAAYKKNTLVDYGATLFSLVVISIPSFFVAIIAIYLFALRWRLLPTSGMTTPGRESFGDSVNHLILPVAILALSQAGPLLRYVRSGMLGELSEDYTRTALAKGAGTPRMLFRHAFRNSLIPLVTVITLNLPGLLAGAIILETVFAWPGMGQLVINAIEQRDYPVVIGFSIVSAALVLACNLAADVLYSVADPRVKLR